MNPKTMRDKSYIWIKKRRGLIFHLIKDYDLYLMILPGIVWFIVFCYIPMYGMTIAFQEFNIIDGYFGSKWVGFKYFIQFVNDPYFFRIIRNTILLGLYRLLWSFWPPILFALLINELKGKLYKKTVQSISYLPYFISTVVLVGMMFDIFKNGGVVNEVLAILKIPQQNFFNDTAWFRTLYVGSRIWQGLGWNSIIYLAAIAGLNIEMFESAIVEGATRFQRIRYITIPGIMPAIIILFILNVKDIIDVPFDQVFLMTNNNAALYETADVIATYVYRRGIEFQQFSYSTAVGIFNNIIALIILLATNRFARKYSETSLW